MGPRDFFFQLDELPFSSGQQWRNRHREQTYGHGERGDGKMYGESNMEIYNAICKTDSQWEFAV